MDLRQQHCGSCVTALAPGDLTADGLTASHIADICPEGDELRVEREGHLELSLVDIEASE